MKNILFIVPDFYPNSTGFANASLNLVKNIADHGEYHVYVFTEIECAVGKELESPNFFLYRRKFREGNKCTRLFYERRKYRFVKDIIEMHDISTIFFETNTFTYLQYWIRNDYPDRVFVRIHSTADTEMQIFQMHSTLGGWIKKRLVFSFMRKVHNIVSTSEYYLEWIRKHYYCENDYISWDKKNYSVIPNAGGFDKDYLETPPWDGKTNCFFTVGKMSAHGIIQKGVTDVIRAIAILYRQNRLPEDFHLTVVGDGTEYDSVVELVDYFNLNEYVSNVRAMSHEDTLKEISKSKCVILTSRFEGQSMFLTEAICLGKPAVITSNTGMSHMVEDGISGFHVRKGSVDEIAKAISRMVLCSKEDIDQMGIRARRIYEDHYSEEAVYNCFMTSMSTRYNGV